MLNDRIDIDSLKEALIHASEWTRGHSELLRELDAACGDGDLGVTVRRGFTAVESLLHEEKSTHVEISDLMIRMGMMFNRVAASSFGVFFATAFMRAGDAVKGKRDLGIEEVGTMFDAAVEGVRARGKAEEGDKTILDALVPAQESLQKSKESGLGLRKALEAAAEAAKNGAEATKGMHARKGRAGQLGTRSDGIQDPGATAVSIFLQGLCGPKAIEPREDLGAIT